MKPINSRGEIINEIPLENPNRSTFDLSYGNTGTGEIGKMIPVALKELLPGDNLRLNAATLLRFEPLAVPITATMKMRHHSFAVPLRQVWNKFDTFITGGKNNLDNSTVPSFQYGAFYNAVAGRFVEGAKYGDFSFDHYMNFIYSNALSNYSDVKNSRYPFANENLDRLLELVTFIVRNVNGEVDNPLEPLDDVKTLLKHSSFGFVQAAIFAAMLRDTMGNGSLLDYMGYPTIDAGSDALYRSDEFATRLQNDSDTPYTFLFNPLKISHSFTMFDDFFKSRVSYRDYAFEYIFPDSDYNSEDSDPTIRLALKNKYLAFVQNTPLYQDFPELVDFLVGMYYDIKFREDGENPYIFDSLTSHYSNLGFALTLTDGHDVETTDVAFNHAYMPPYSVLPLRAFARVWYHYFRDQNLDRDDDPDNYVGDTVTLPELHRYMVLPPMCWRKDLFNTATLQAFQTNMVVPLSTPDGGETSEASVVNVYDAETGGTNEMKVPSSWLSVVDNYVNLNQRDKVNGVNLIAHGLSGLSLQNLRKCEMLAKWLDKALYLGWTYADRLSSSFAVRYSDARLQLPEYLGGSASDVEISTLTNTTTTSEQLAGDQTAYAQGLNQLHCDDYFSEEHQVYFTILSVVPSLTYPHAVDKMLIRQSKFDYPWPEFANLGQDIVTAGEVCTLPAKSFGRYLSDVPFSPLHLFAYQSRYYDQKASINVQHGEMNGSMRMYTFGSVNENDPVQLNAGFVHCIPSTEPFVGARDWQFIYDTYNKIYVNRCLPAFDRVL